MSSKALSSGSPWHRFFLVIYEVGKAMDQPVWRQGYSSRREANHRAKILSQALAVGVDLSGYNVRPGVKYAVFVVQP